VRCKGLDGPSALQGLMFPGWKAPEFSLSTGLHWTLPHRISCWRRGYVAAFRPVNQDW